MSPFKIKYVMKNIFILMLGFLVFSNSYAQKKSKTPESVSQLIAGPMLGYVEHREASIWLIGLFGHNDKFIYYPANQPEKKTEMVLNGYTGYWNTLNGSVHTLRLKALEMGTTYFYEIWLGDKKMEFEKPLQFTTKTIWEWRTDPPAFSFLAGSCLYVNDSLYDRPGKPYGQGTDILLTMAKSNANFMLWLGDNTYTREADYTSESGLRYRYLHTRSDKNLQPLLRAMPHYATWDDHDFGTNNGGRSYELKEESRQIFAEYWPARSYGENNEGIYTRFKYGDCEFFMLDDRYFRDDTDMDESKYPQKSQLGEKQKIWVKNALKDSHAPFKFVVIGGQFLNEYTTKESYNLYKNEREELLNFIADQKIEGVVFLSGDRHHTELLKNAKFKSKTGYDIYDLTSSPLSSGANINVFRDSLEANNPMRIKGTLVAEPNYCQLFLSGKRKERILTIKCFNTKGELKWEQRISEAELRASRP
jgi:alkaline phosphatase D